MNELYELIEKKIKASGYPRPISGADVYDDICDQIEGKENGEETEVKDFEEIYKQIALECFQYLGFKSFEEVDRLTIPEWKLLRKAIELKQEEKDYRNHLQAFLNFKAKARKKSGRPVFTIFKKFYDHEANLREIMKEENKTDRFARVKQLLKREEG